MDPFETWAISVCGRAHVSDNREMKNQKGFTLVEVLVAGGILMVLA
ncbi:MAG: prepilin-type N-terminal cleavage/methylation domain-containing protein, partial [Proteobacteria bacterium]